VSIRCFRVRIEGYVIDQDFGGPAPAVEPDGWLPEEAFKALTTSGNVSITATLVDTIEEKEEV
jgi:hypothetical protein